MKSSRVLLVVFLAVCLISAVSAQDEGIEPPDDLIDDEDPHRDHCLDPDEDEHDIFHPGVPHDEHCRKLGHID